LFIVVSLAATLGQHGLEESMSPRSCSIAWHSFSPWHNLSRLSSAHGLPKELLLVVKVVQVVFYVSTSILPPKIMVLGSILPPKILVLGSILAK
jgi:flagellar biosynthesis protein FlhB